MESFCITITDFELSSVTVVKDIGNSMLIDINFSPEERLQISRLSVEAASVSLAPFEKTVHCLVLPIRSIVSLQEIVVKMPDGNMSPMKVQLQSNKKMEVQGPLNISVELHMNAVGYYRPPYFVITGVDVGSSPLWLKDPK